MPKIPGATYRLQFNPQFVFQDAIAIVEYLAELNISHIYASPYLQSVKGSNHGYDVADPTKVNQELGGEKGLQNFCEALAAKSLGLVVDIVPNHMTTKCPDNPWWTSVLKYGLASPYAEYFDIDWSPPEEKNANKIVLPILGEQYDKAVADKKIQLQFKQGIFTINYFDQSFPVASFSLAHVLLQVAAILQLKPLEVIVDELKKNHLTFNYNLNVAPTYFANLQILEQELLQILQTTKDISKIIEPIVCHINESYAQLNDLLQQQNYCLVFWRNSKDFISYRRFFHIDTLVGLRIENEKVFLATHNLVAQWLKFGLVDGIRVDHIDGLRDPLEYIKRLRKFAPKFWLIVEKILIGKEKLPHDWPIAGSTGYDFLNTVMGLFVDSANEKLFTDFYVNFIGGKANYYEVLREKKLLVLRNLLGGDVNYLTELVVRIIQQDKLKCNFTRDEIHTAIQELIACFPVYRSYIRAEQRQITATDREIIVDAVKRAQNNVKLNSSIFSFLESILLLNYSGKEETEFVMRFQQLTGPAMAKGEEDTAFYCFNRFVALNEVGGDPGIFGISIGDFHRIMQYNAVHFPHSMLATSTHDTKRSEDIRSRLTLLSEMPEAWFDVVKKWIIHNEKHHAVNVPDRNTQYFLYQNLVGAWPIAKERVFSFMEKSVREAKTRTSWFSPNPSYEQKVRSFVDEILEDKEFYSSLKDFVARLIEFGRINSLSQVAIKLTAPGVPDFYQGSELWNFNFVDPDNRRPVDFQLHNRLLQEMKFFSVDEVMARMDEGLPKLWLIYKTLGIRKKNPTLFDNAEYSPLILKGEKAQHGIAFLRGKKVLTFVPRFVISLRGNWEKTYLNIPSGIWRNILTEEYIQGEEVLIADIIKKFPVAILIKEC